MDKIIRTLVLLPFLLLLIFEATYAQVDDGTKAVDSVDHETFLTSYNRQAFEQRGDPSNYSKAFKDYSLAILKNTKIVVTLPHKEGVGIVQRTFDKVMDNDEIEIDLSEEILDKMLPILMDANRLDTIKTNEKYTTKSLSSSEVRLTQKLLGAGVITFFVDAEDPEEYTKAASIRISHAKEERKKELEDMLREHISKNFSQEELENYDLSKIDSDNHIRIRSSRLQFLKMRELVETNILSRPIYLSESEAEAIRKILFKPEASSEEKAKALDAYINQIKNNLENINDKEPYCVGVGLAEKINFSYKRDNFLCPKNASALYHLDNHSTAVFDKEAPNSSCAGGSNANYTKDKDLQLDDCFGFEANKEENGP